MKILYAVHRYYPFPGGSEYYVRDMALETLGRGHQVAVFSGQHAGDCEGIRVSSDPNILLEKWDLIVVHGGDVGLQNFVLSNAKQISSPILYMLILPSHSQTCVQALKDCDWLGWSTNQDFNHICQYSQQNKAVYIPHGINEGRSISDSFDFKKELNITGTMLLSCGGYWPNKAMPQLVEVFQKAQLPDTTLVLTGYDNSHGLMPNSTHNVKSLLIDDRSQVIRAIASADAYVLHSTSEGFGLVLLESMLNSTPWIARNIAGANLLQSYGMVYDNDNELMNILKNGSWRSIDVKKAKDFVQSNHTIINTVDGILSIFKN